MIVIHFVVPDAVVDGKPGRKTSFEVTVNDKLIYSKLEKGGFPNFDKVNYKYPVNALLI